MSGGFTLFEMLLVLALLVAVSAMAWPAIEGSFASARLRTSADKVRSVWSEARLEAMRTGTIYEFRYIEETAKYQVRAWTAEALAAAAVPTSQAAGMTGVEETPDGDFASAFSENTLPGGITFEVGSQNIDQRATLTALAAGAHAGAEGLYSPPILFYPDGTTSDAVVHLKNEKGLFIRVALRGITGISRSSELMTVDELMER